MPNSFVTTIEDGVCKHLDTCIHLDYTFLEHFKFAKHHLRSAIANLILFDVKNDKNVT